MNYLIKNNAFGQDRSLELLTALFEGQSIELSTHLLRESSFQECDEYNRSMLIFDIDSLIAVNVNDSSMSKSESIANIPLYQFIREKCKKAVVEQQGDVSFLKERWIVMIVRQMFLRNSLLRDVDFKKTALQSQEEDENEQQRLDSETSRTCPKCERIYVPSQANHDSCHYHDGYIVDVERSKTIIPAGEAQMLIQRARLAAADSAADPKLVWTCCLSLVVDSKPCRTGACGLPDQLKDKEFESEENMRSEVRKFFESNAAAKKQIDVFVTQPSAIKINRPK